jgi:hypothetical protein
MVEYGNGVGQVAGGSGGGGGQAPDMGATLSQMVNDSVTTLGTLPPAALICWVPSSSSSAGSC